MHESELNLTARFRLHLFNVHTGRAVIGTDPCFFTPRGDTNGTYFNYLLDLDPSEKPERLYFLHVRCLLFRLTFVSRVFRILPRLPRARQLRNTQNPNLQTRFSENCSNSVINLSSSGKFKHRLRPNKYKYCAFHNHPKFFSRY